MQRPIRIPAYPATSVRHEVPCATGLRRADVTALVTVALPEPCVFQAATGPESCLGLRNPTGPHMHGRLRLQFSLPRAFVSFSGRFPILPTSTAFTNSGRHSAPVDTYCSEDTAGRLHPDPK